MITLEQARELRRGDVVYAQMWVTCVVRTPDGGKVERACMKWRRFTLLRTYAHKRTPTVALHACFGDWVVGPNGNARLRMGVTNNRRQ